MKLIKYVLIVVFVIFCSLYLGAKIYSADEPAVVIKPRIADTVRIKNDLVFLTKECRFRNYKHLNALNKSADFIKTSFTEVSTRVEEQNYSFNNFEFRNIICSMGPENADRIIIGAHYDVCGDQEGADDNASGISGLLELARLFKNIPLKYRIDFVAYAQEEPPFFKSNYMGSYIHAKSLFDNKIKIKGMICLEMIGFYSGKENSQTYPISFLKWFYGNKGNYITVVQKFGNGSFGKLISKTMKRDPVLPTKSFYGPASLPGVDFSDHLNYWKFGFSAVMITNTAFYRNHNYHTSGDTVERLTIGNIGLVTDELFRTLQRIK